MNKIRKAFGLEWMPIFISAIGFVFLLVVFAINLRNFAQTIESLASRDIALRTELAVRILREPLRTQDFNAIYSYSAVCRQNDIYLKITSGNGGVFFDSRTVAEKREACLDSSLDCEDFKITLMIALNKVRHPLYRALPGIVLAALVGVFGVVLFFFVTYRQRVRIRELKRLEEFRRSFIADVSHEIKTPLTGILTAVDMLDGDSPLLALIKKESLRLNGLVQSILDLARLEREHDFLRLEQVNIADLVRDVASTYPCKCEVKEETVMLNCDAQLMVQALTNLLNNAVRHSQSDDIKVSLERRGNHVYITVEDHGVGIPPEHEKRVFERFHRVDPSRAAESGGAGLGLAIVQRIARLHGGEVNLYPAVPHGCRFVLKV